MTGRSSDTSKWFNENNALQEKDTFAHIDICSLDQNGPHAARAFIKELLTDKQVDFKIQCTPNIDDQLFRLFIDQQNEQKTNQASNFSIGFPLVRIRGKRNQPSYLAPLLIWRLNLQQGDQPYQWKIKRQKEMGPNINFALHRYLLQECKIDLLKLSHPIINQANMSAIALSKICYELSAALGSKEDLFVEQIVPLQTSTDRPIICSAILGFFSNIAPYAIDLSKVERPQIQHPFGLQTLDPAQQKIFQAFWKNDAIEVANQPGLGKSHLIEQLLINALSNGHRSLFIADSAQRIKKLRNSLMAIGLDHLLLEITDSHKDDKKIKQALQYKSTTPKEDFDEATFKLLIQRCKRQLDNLDLAYSHLQQPVFDKANWSEVLPRYLNANSTERQDLLDNQLSIKDFTFHPTEYISLKEAVQISEQLFHPINNLKHPLQPLNADIFLEYKKETAKQKVEEKIQYFTQKFKQLHHRYILKQQDYTRDLSHNYDAFFEEVSLRIEQLKSFIEDNQLLYGSDFEDSGILQKSKLKVYGVFSGKHKNILQAREQINRDFKILSQLLLSNYKDAFHPQEHIDQKSSHKIVEHLNELEDQLYHWQELQKSSIPETLQRLNAKSIHPGLDYAEQISELEYSLDVIIEALNESKLYQLPLQNRMLTIPMRQLFIQDILSQLQSTKNHLPQFDEFYDWQRHWLLLPEVHRQLISAIINVHPKDWNQVFESWYFYQRLRADYHFKMPKSEEQLTAFNQHLQQLQQLIPAQIRQQWRTKSTKEKVGKHIIKMGLNELINTQFKHLSQQFPIIAISPIVADHLQFSEHVLFDLALGFNTQNSASNSLNYPAKRILKFSNILSDDRRQLQKSFHLQYLHHPMPGPAFHFANTMIHGKRLHLTKPLDQTDVFQVHQFNGPARHRVNPSEAEAIAQALIKAGNDPSEKNKITLVCLTVEQRDLIARKLYDYSRTLTSAEAGAFSNFLENKIAITHLFEPFQIGYDTLIFSLTQDEFDTQASNTFPRLHSKLGLQQIHRLISAPFKKIKIYHSLSAEKINRYALHQTKKSAQLLAQWIQNAQAEQSNSKADFTPFLKDTSTEKTDSFYFLQEVANLLSPYLGKSRIELNTTFKGIKIPLLIHGIHAENKPIALLADYAMSPADYLAHDWKIKQINHLKNLGLEVFGVWSANWLEQPAMSARRLASAILKLDKN